MPQCKCLTKVGKQCKNIAQPNSNLCGTHKDCSQLITSLAQPIAKIPIKNKQNKIRKEKVAIIIFNILFQVQIQKKNIKSNSTYVIRI